MGPKAFACVTPDRKLKTAAALVAHRAVRWGATARRLLFAAAGCLLLTGCTVFGQSGKSQGDLSPSYSAAARQKAIAQQKAKNAEGNSWLPSWLRPKDPPPPATIGDWMELQQSKLPPSK